ncbi:MAG TPA: hypothetical protein VK850_04490, partial [Candidatus Binatia bacterium]|nr:hypothetical protein [Candidatus Binatia bacterium]
MKSYLFFRTAAFCGIVVQAVAQAPTNWQQHNVDPSVVQPRAITFVNGQWIIADQIGATFASTDAKVWDRVVGPPAARRVIYAENQYVAVTGDYSAGAIYTSADRQTWQLRQNTPGDLTGLAYGNGVFVATGRESAWMSQDGITWRPVNTNILFWLPEIIFAQGKFVAVGAQRQDFAATKPLVAVSINGVDWTNVNPPGEPFLQGVTYGNGTFVANGDGGSFLTSPDAITWTMRGGVDEPPGLPPIRFTGMAFGNGKFVAASEHFIY